MGQLTAEDRARLAERLSSRLPDGYAIENLRTLECSAHILDPASTELEPLEMAVAQELREAGGPPLITDQKPTIMRVVAWVAHEGINRNRLAFRAEDLQAAATKIAPPNLLVMDFNHSAVRAYSMEEKVIGVWWKAEYAFDQAVGRHGLLATGIMWSWAFPDYADRMLAEQSRNGKIDFSMACISRTVTETSDEDGPYEIAHDPVFFTFSALDVAPGDEGGNGEAKEGATDAEEEALKNRVKNRTELATADAAPVELDAKAVIAALTALAAPPPHIARASEAAPVPEDATMEELLAFLKENAAKVADRDTLVALEAKVTDLVATLNTNAAEAATVQAALSELEAKHAETETAMSAVTTELEAANGRIAELEAALTERDEKLATYAEAEAKAAAEAKLAARLAELPEHIKAAHDALSEDKRLEQEGRWAKKSDEEWAEVLETFALVPKMAMSSYLARSQREGGAFPTGGAGTGKSVSDRLSQFKN